VGLAAGALHPSSDALDRDASDYERKRGGGLSMRLREAASKASVRLNFPLSEWSHRVWSKDLSNTPQFQQSRD
jgi:hypothetical protein